MVLLVARIKRNRGCAVHISTKNEILTSHKFSSIDEYLIQFYLIFWLTNVLEKWRNDQYCKRIIMKMALFEHDLINGDFDFSFVISVTS